jgi:hypothetical protein
MSTRFLPALSLLAVCSLISLPASATSQVRIVRLSDVHGTVQINKSGQSAFEPAFLNLPITQGTQLKTGADGRAEVEFEDGSSLRLGPNSAVSFTSLTLADSGTRNSAINLAEGIAYLNWLGKDEVSLKFSHETVDLDHAAHFRVVDGSDAASLAVFKGPVDVDAPDGKLTLEKHKTATFEHSENDKAKVTNKVEDAQMDSWDKDATSYHDEYAKVKSDSSPYGYGLSDLNYYGSFSTVPGYGMMWQPFFTGVGWDPFMDGMWGFYPGMGYMFASPYPWGWLPYRYGNWMFVPSMGWMWQPGMWNSWNAIPRYTAAAGVPVHALVPPTGTTKTVFVGRAAQMSTLTSSRMTLSRGSAGLFIPRGSIDNLRNLNREVAKRGFVNMQPTPQFAVQTQRRAGFAGESSGFHGMEGQGGAGRAGMSAPSASSSAAHASASAASGGHH